MGKWIGIALVVILVVVGYSYYTSGPEEAAEPAPAASDTTTDGTASGN